MMMRKKDAGLVFLAAVVVVAIAMSATCSSAEDPESSWDCYEDALRCRYSDNCLDYEDYEEKAECIIKECRATGGNFFSRCAHHWEKDCDGLCETLFVNVCTDDICPKAYPKCMAACANKA